MSNLLEQLLSDQKLRDSLEEALRYIYSSGFVAGEETMVASTDDKMDEAYYQGFIAGREYVFEKDKVSAAKAATQAHLDGLREGVQYVREDDQK